MLKRVGLLIGVIRVAAVIVIVFTVMALWNFMLWLPWQVDCAISAAAALAFAYRFERDTDSDM